MLWRSCPAPNVGGDPFNIHQQAVDKELRKHFSLSDKDIRTAAALAPGVVFPGRRSGLHRRLDPGPPALQNRPKTLLHPPGGAGGGPGYLKEAPSAFHLLTKKSTRLSASLSRWLSCPPWGFSGPTFSSCSFCCNDRQRNKKRTAPKFGAVLFTFQRSL